MTSETIRSSPPFRIDHNDWEQAMQVVSAVTVDPIKNFVCYIFPFLGAFSSNHLEVRENDETQNGMMPSTAKRAIFDEIRLLKESAGITRSIGLYTSLCHTFLSHGGILSLTEPVIAIPHQHLFRTGSSYFTTETDLDGLAANIWKFTDDETRFLICRELGFIKQNDSLIKLAVKVAFIVLVFFCYALPISTFALTAILLGAAALYFFSERGLQGDVDKIAVDILAKRLNDPAQAKRAALTALEKMRLQNIERRHQSSLCSYYISEDGRKNYLDLGRPFVGTRIAALESL